MSEGAWGGVLHTSSPGRKGRQSRSRPSRGSPSLWMFRNGEGTVDCCCCASLENSIWTGNETEDIEKGGF